MADRKITELSAMSAGGQATGDLLTIVDVSEAAAADKNKKITMENLFKGIPSNVGIGTSSPQQFLHVHGTNGRIQITSAGTGSASGDGALFGYDGSDDLFINNREATNFKIFNNGSERLQIDSSGRVLVGTASAFSSSSAHKLQIADSVGGYLNLARSSTSVGSGSILGRIGGWSNAGSSYNLVGQIDIVGDGTHAAGDKPTRLVFSTTADGASSATERMRIDSSGRLLRGTTSTSANANTVLQGSSGGTTGAARLFLQRGSVPANGQAMANIFFADNSSNEGAKITAVRDGGTWTSGSSHPTRLEIATTADGASSPTERMRIDSSGQLILTGDGGSLNNSLDLSYNGTSGQAQINADSNGGSTVLTFGTSSSGSLSERMRLDSSGRLLVGTTSSTTFDGVTAQVQISGSNENTSSLSLHRTNGSPFVTLNSGATSGTAGKIAFQGFDGGSGYLRLAEIAGVWDGTGGVGDGPGRLVFSTTADGAGSTTERMRISADGTFNSHTTDGTFNIRTSRATGSGTDSITLKAGTGDISGGTTTFKVLAKGDVSNQNNVYGQISDQKLKENIVDANSQWNNIKDIRVRNFNFIEGETHTQIGVIAQEVETISPGLVDESVDIDEDGNDLGTVTKSVKYSVLYMKAVKALQEAMDRIETLEAKVAALEAQ